MVNMGFRIGQSEDIHRLEDNQRAFILGGVKIPYHLGLVSHSDGDVVYHALAEAFLGALALGDLGTFFPDNSDLYLDMDSSLILKRCYEMVLEKGYHLVNTDISIILEKPKIKDYILQIRTNIAEALKTDIDNISVKAMTNEKCDDLGNGKCVKATAIVLVERD